MRERDIEDRILREPEALGYGAVAIIRNARVSPGSGRVDLLVLPSVGPKRVVLVEVKRTADRDVGSKVIGQLIMYYAAALQWGTEGLRLLGDYARRHREEALSSTKASLNRLAGGAKSQQAGWAALQEGATLCPADFDLLLGMEADPPPKLIRSLQVLESHHGLKVRVVVAGENGTRMFPDGTSAAGW